MNYLSENKKFSFVSKAVAKDTFGVVSFTGSEGLSRLYDFDITLVSDNANVDMDAVMREGASFFIHRPDKSKVPFHGIIAEFDLLQAVGSFYLYRARLVPKVWQLTLTHHNQIFLNAAPKDIISQVLQDGGLSSLDFEFRLQGSYVTWEYACQYGESHYSFICRWMERNGIYFFFDQSGDSEKLVMTDAKMSHIDSSFGSKLTYAPVSGLEAMHLDESVQSFICRRQQIPQTVTMQDYNYRQPSLEVTGTAQVDSNGHGEMHFYGDHFRTPEEGNKLAKIRSEEFLCLEKQFHGESTVPYLMSGYTFSLQKHFRSDMNCSYHTIALEHIGNQVSYLLSGIRGNLAAMEQESVYHNSFTAIESSVQFRAQRLTERPRLHGTITARIDAAGSGKYAEVDKHGRYKVILPFDRSGRSGGKASAWVRMMQPYGGADHGMHFPLHKGCEVLLSFIDGDPDRPVIAGAVANPDHPSQITTDNQTMSKLTTSGGNKIHIEDKEGTERILLHSPKQGSFVRIGAHNDPSTAKWKFKTMTKDTDHFGIHLATDGIVDVQAEAKNEIILGETTEWIGGLDMRTVLLGSVDTVIGLDVQSVLGGALSYQGPEALSTSPEKTRMNALETSISINSDNIAAQRTMITNNMTAIGDEHMRITANDTNITEIADVVVANEVKIAANKTAITENADAVVVNETNITANKTDIIEIADVVVANETKIAENSTEISANATTISENTSEISENLDLIAGMVEIV